MRGGMKIDEVGTERARHLHGLPELRDRLTPDRRVEADGHMAQEASFERGDRQAEALAAVTEPLQALGVGEISGEMLEAKRRELYPRKLRLRRPFRERAVLLQRWFISEVDTRIGDDYTETHQATPCDLFRYLARRSDGPSLPQCLLASGAAMPLASWAQGATRAATK